MGAAGPPEHQREPGPATLGDLLYADAARLRIAEKEWVALVGAIAAGDQLALRTLFARLHRVVYTLMVRLTNDRQTAEELTVDVFHDVWRRAATYTPEGGPVVGWILNQARSRAIDRLRFEHRKKRVGDGTEAPPAAPAAPGPLETVDLREQTARLREALALLTPEERQAIETAFFAEHTYLETAAVLDQPLGTVKTRVRSGLDKLRRALREPDAR